MPLIARDFRLPVTTVEWVAMSFLLALAVLLPIFGRLGDMAGHKRIYCLGFLLFTVASGAAVIAPGFLFLIGASLLQAAGGAMMMAAGPAILTLAFPPSRRGQALGLQGLFTYLGLTIGPVLGGFLASLSTWRAVFFINLPVGVFGIILSVLVIGEDRSTGKERFDLAGAATFGTALLSGLLLLSQGPSWGWSWPTLSLLVVAPVSGVFFLRWESRTAEPMLDLRLFRRRLFSSSVASAFLNYTVVFILMFLLPFYLLDYGRLSPDQAGFLLTAMPVVMVVLTPIAGSISDRAGSQLLTALGMALLALAAASLAWLPSFLNPAAVIWRLALAGAGVGLFVSPNSNAILGSAPSAQRGIASGVMALARSTGMVAGVAVGGYILAVFGGGPAGATGAVSGAYFPLAFHWAMLTAAFLSLAGMAMCLGRGGAATASTD